MRRFFPFPHVHWVQIKQKIQSQLPTSDICQLPHFIKISIFCTIWRKSRFLFKKRIFSPRICIKIKLGWNLLRSFLSFCLLSLATSIMFWFMSSPFQAPTKSWSNDCYIQTVIDRHMRSSLQSAWKCQRTNRLLLFYTSPPPLWEHKPLSKGASSMDHQITQLSWHQNNRKVRFPYFEQAGTSESRSLCF